MNDNSEFASNNNMYLFAYSIQGYYDKDLLDYTLWRKCPFIKFAFKFDEELFELQFTVIYFLLVDEKANFVHKTYRCR